MNRTSSVKFIIFDDLERKNEFNGNHATYKGEHRLRTRNDIL